MNGIDMADEMICSAVDEYAEKLGHEPKVLHASPDLLLHLSQNPYLLATNGEPDTYMFRGMKAEINKSFKPGQFMVNDSLMRDVDIFYHPELGYTVVEKRADGRIVPGSERKAKTQTEAQMIVCEKISCLGEDYYQAWNIKSLGPGGTFYASDRLRKPNA